MEPQYDHKKHEDVIYEKWLSSGAFSPNNSDKKPFTVIMPPPNANDPLHIGHARFVAIEDCLVRYNRMKGVPTLYLPGSDHAGIETQYVFEKKLAKDGKSRFDYDRDTLYKMIWEYVENNTGVMETQLKKLGASCDWSRFKFTLDPEIVKVVYKTFKKLSDDDLLYRGERIVNYCTKCGTAYSQLEVDYIERDDNLYYLDYGTLTIATTRPETIFADVAIAVNPKDPKYKELVGKTAKIPLINREIPIIADNLVDIGFGTSALKVTPAHDPVDYEIGQKHNLPLISVIDESGRMTNTPEKYIGMKVAAAREAVVSDLNTSGLIKKIEPIHHSVGTCYRDKSVIEPRISKQWFIKVAPLTKIVLQAIKDKKVKFAAKKYEKIATHWLKNLKDWNISRQIVWGIRIPAFKCEKCLEWTITDGVIPDSCKSCGFDKLKQDTDTFDTWFSSGQWPFATLQTTKEGDFEKFYPTTVMETGYDILPFWVIRMLLLGFYLTDKTPFENVLLHGLVRDKDGLKISKSKGNVINPIEMIDKYGSDALRMGLLWGGLVENDIALSEEKINGQRKFANKIWNAARFVINFEGDAPVNKEFDLWYQKELPHEVTKQMEKYKLNEAAEIIYSNFWNRFCDQDIEKAKKGEIGHDQLMKALNTLIKLLHPFMPFVTEAVWKEIGNEDLLITSQWPSISK